MVEIKLFMSWDPSMRNYKFPFRNFAIFFTAVLLVVIPTSSLHGPPRLWGINSWSELFFLRGPIIVATYLISIMTFSSFLTNRNHDFSDRNRDIRDNWKASRMLIISILGIHPRITFSHTPKIGKSHPTKISYLMNKSFSLLKWQVSETISLTK